MEGLVVLEELHVGSTALKAALKLDLILHHESVVFIRDGLVELGRDGVVGSLVLQNQALVAVNPSERSGLLDLPLSHVLPLLLGVLLLRIGPLPS